jgi:hypothetical protein
MKAREIGVPEMEGMTDQQVRITNNVCNDLMTEHHMCLDCAIAIAVAMTWANVAPRKEGMRTPLCSEACWDAMEEFLTKLSDEPPRVVSLDQLPSQPH